MWLVSGRYQFLEYIELQAYSIIKKGRKKKYFWRIKYNVGTRGGVECGVEEKRCENEKVSVQRAEGEGEGAICDGGVWRNEKLYANQCREMFYGMADSDKKCKGPRGFGRHQRMQRRNFYYIIYYYIISPAFEYLPRRGQSSSLSFPRKR